MPAVTDARKHFPDAKISWMVEEAYVPLAKLHPGVDEVIPVAVRRWRKEILKLATFSKARSEIGALRAELPPATVRHDHRHARARQNRAALEMGAWRTPRL